MRVDGGRKRGSLLAIKMKARAVAGRGEESLLIDPGSVFHPGLETELLLFLLLDIQTPDELPI